MINVIWDDIIDVFLFIVLIMNIFSMSSKLEFGSTKFWT